MKGVVKITRLTKYTSWSTSRIFIGIWKSVFYRSQKLTHWKNTFIYLSFALCYLLYLGQDYMFYYIDWKSLIFTGVIPFIYLIVVNMLIVLAIQKKIPSIRINSTSLRRQRLCNVIFKQDPKLPKIKLPRHSALTLIAISVMFMICNFPRLFLNIAEWNIELVTVIDDNGCEQAPDWFEVLMSLSNFSLTMNSTINCIIYYYFSKKFKRKMGRNIRWVQALVWNLIVTTGGSWWRSHSF